MGLERDGLTEKYKKRRAAVLRAAVKQSDGRVAGLMITNPVDVHYLSGLREGCPALLIGKKWCVLFTSNMFKDLVPRFAPGAETMLFKHLDQEMAGIFNSRGVKGIGIQTDHMAIDRYRSLCKTIPEKKLVPVPGVVGRCRAVKDDGEIALTQKAIRIAEKAMKQLLGGGAGYFIGRTEKQLAAELEYRMRSLGADKQGFQGNGTIVGAGPNSAACHHVPTNRKVKRGDPVLFDWGAELDGYRSDMTRVVFIDSVPERIGKIYSLVREAHLAAVDLLKPGVSCRKVDAAARDWIAAAGYTTEFRHGLGHGIGLQIHEAPTLGTASKERLKKNMIVTIEPGIYFIGTGGVRLEDDYLITSDGCKNLCTLPTKLDKWILT
ncbi:putative peptidase [Pontiella desulfatans]|uniref:Putative peptidase n=1 Tax=Pontiella desulfatans TaxID=2750659 RepID=A0A6C2TVS7_PONDE|nr:Xaa-Pro peptidase family protein [Pontiella desulfatans]VGO11719.1 putative peptidase [Pontiella desulfatans]